MSKLSIVMYHYVRDLSNSRYPDIKGLDYKLFKEQIQFLTSHYNIMKIEDVIEAYDTKHLEKLPENAMLLTFDDGYIDNYTYAFPILDQYKVQGTFYVPGKTFKESVLLDVNKIHFILASGNIGEIMKDVISFVEEARKSMEEYKDIPDTEQLIELYAVANRFDCKEVIFVKRMLQAMLPEKLRGQIADKLFEKYVGMPEDKFAKELYMNEEQMACMVNHGMHIGLHGYDHYWLGNMDEELAKRDIDESIRAMSGLVKEDSWVFNYPYGSYNENVLNYLGEKGCKLAMTTEVRVADLQKDHRLLLPRLDTNDYPPKSKNYLNIL